MKVPPGRAADFSLAVGIPQSAPLPTFMARGRALYNGAPTKEMGEETLVTAICEPGLGRYSETFIRAQVESLPGTVYHLHSGWPQWRYGDEGLIPMPLRGAVRFRKRAPELIGGIAERMAHTLVARFLRAHKVQVVLAQYGPTAVSLMESCKLARLPLVAHFHGYDAYRRDTLAENREGYAQLFRIAAAIVAVSQEMVQQLIGLGAPADKVFYNSCGVDLKSFVPGDPSDNPPDFLSVGRFVDKKAPHLVILAFREALREAPQARLRMVGDGALKEACHQLVLSLGLNDRVELLGIRTPGQVQRLMHDARAFVQHSVKTSEGDSEGTPVAVLEASASGLPVLATRHGGILQAVVEGETGLLSDERDIGSMARNIVRMAKEPVTAHAMGSKGRAHVNEYYSMEKSIAGLASILVRAKEGARQVQKG